MKKLLLQCFWRFNAMRSRLLGVEVGAGVALNGMPSFRIKGNGKIILKRGSCINSAFWSNPLNVSGATRLFAAQGAVLELGEEAGVSSSQLIANVGIEIGSRSFVGAGCLICDSDMHEVPLGSSNPVRTGPIKIGEGVFIGARCIVLKGVTIGDGAVVAAGSVVNKDVPPNMLAAGNPAVVVRPVDG